MLHWCNSNIMLYVTFTVIVIYCITLYLCGEEIFSCILLLFSTFLKKQGNYSSQSSNNIIGSVVTLVPECFLFVKWWTEWRASRLTNIRGLLCNIICFVKNFYIPYYHHCNIICFVKTFNFDYQLFNIFCLVKIFISLITKIVIFLVW